MAEFIALPVGQGDAFYLDRGDYTILVDGGKSRSKFPGMFHRVTDKDSVDILVCTHNDSDHVNGVLGFLKSKLNCKELWLPGRWLEVLPDLLVPLPDFVNRVGSEIINDRKIGRPDEHSRYPSSVEEFARRFEANTQATEETLRRDAEDELHILNTAEKGWPASIIRDLENAEHWDTPPWAWPSQIRYEWLGGYYYHCPASALTLTLSVIHAATRIREAAILAFRKGVTVRWFKHDPITPRGGIPGVLEPANARELLTMRQRKASLVEYISLSVANRESLVFWAPPTDEMPGVLFNADSDLAEVNLNFSTQNSLATAPHHGSEANARAYEVVEFYATPGRGDSITWIRSDGRYPERPGNSYLTKTSTRFCTLCRFGKYYSPNPKQTVRLFAFKGRWFNHMDCSPCTCWP